MAATATAVPAVDMVWDISAADVALADRLSVTSVLSDVAALRRWLDGVEVACVQRLHQLAVASPSMSPEQIAATATRGSLRSAARTTRRAETAEAVPEMGQALTAGAVSGEHLDAVTAALSGLEPAQRRQLAGHGSELAVLAATSNPDEFRRQVGKIARQIEADDGVARLERHKRAVRLRAWIDKQTGMMRLSGEFDAETGAALLKRLNDRVDTLFHGKTPDLCPTDPFARQDFLRGHALLDLLANGSGPGKVEMCVVVDLRTIVFGRHGESRVDFGVDGVDLPVDVIRRMGQYADIVPVLIDENGVVLKMGRTRRLVTRDQRRAIRAMYRRCVIPGCQTPVGQCEPHHWDEWDDGGLTDLEVLAPVCKHHHDVIHANGWVLTLDADRRLTVSCGDGVIMTTGPPCEQWT